MIVGIPTIIFIHHLLRRNAAIADERDCYKTLLNMGSEGCCWWLDTDIAISCSTLFYQMLNLDASRPVGVSDLLHKFPHEAAHRLEKALQLLHLENKHFSLNLPIAGTDRILLVTGGRIPPINALYVLDITHSNTLGEDVLKSKIQALESERDILQRMTDTLPLALWYRDKENRIIYCNQSYAGALELSPEEIVAHSLELIDQKRPISPYHLAVKARDSGGKQTQRAHLVIDGQRRLLEISEVPLVNLSESVGYAIDLTEMEDMSRELNKHIAAHHEVLQNLSTPIAVYGADTRLMFFNTAYKKLFQFEEGYLHSKPSFGDVLQELRDRRKLPEYPDFPAFKRGRLQLFKTLMNPIQELIHQPDDQILRLLISPHPLGGLLMMFDDVTDKLALERRYNTLIAVQKETLDHLYEGIIVFGSDNRLRLSNPALARIWQLDLMDLLPGRHAGDLLDQIQHLFSESDDWKSFRVKLLNVFNGRTSQTGQLNRSDGSLIQYAYVPLPDGSHLLCFVDVTDRWRFEKALQERNEALEQADTLKSDFISSVSYELRAPINTVIGFADILLNQYFGQLNERQLDYCRGVNDSAQRLLGLINDILDFASIEAGQLTLTKQPIQLESFLSSTVALVYSRAHDQGLEVLYENKSTFQTFPGDESRLKQALFNLLSNAIKYTPVGGRIELIADSQNEGALSFSVKDTGVGISDKDQARIFKAFERTTYSKSRDDGTGLGLPLVKSLIELHDGNIRIESQLGSGTIITCTIPTGEESSHDEDRESENRSY